MTRTIRTVTAALVTAGLAAVLAAAPPSSQAAAEPTPWQHVIAYSHRSHACRPVPASVRADLGIGHRPARMRIGDTTYIWARGAHGTVTTYTS